MVKAEAAPVLPPCLLLRDAMVPGFFEPFSVLQKLLEEDGCAQVGRGAEGGLCGDALSLGLFYLQERG